MDKSVLKLTNVFAIIQNEGERQFSLTNYFGLLRFFSVAKVFLNFDKKSLSLTEF